MALKALCIATLALAACTREPPTREGPVAGRSRVAIDLSTQAVVPGTKCIVHLHGKGGRGAMPSIDGGITHLHPEGNQYAWGGLEWHYFPQERYEEGQATLNHAVAEAGCERVILHGFSNGASFAAKLFCRGESLGGRLSGVIVDDPVPDHGVDNCKPAPGLKVKLYTTGALAHATDGWDCAQQKYTCEGNATIGISRYAQALGVPVTASVNSKHLEHPSPPEYSTW